jgi:hypothetical protein
MLVPALRTDFVFRFPLGVARLAGGLAPVVPDNPYASCSQAVKGNSTSSRCLICTM